MRLCRHNHTHGASSLLGYSFRRPQTRRRHPSAEAIGSTQSWPRSSEANAARRVAQVTIRYAPLQRANDAVTNVGVPGFTDSTQVDTASGGRNSHFVPLSG